MFRYIENPSGVQPNPYGTYAVPRDFVDIASGEDPSKLMDLLHLVILSVPTKDSDKSVYLSAQF